MSFAWYFEFFATRQPDPIWRVSVFPWTAWLVILLVVALTYYFYYLLSPTKVSLKSWVLFCFASFVISLFIGFMVVMNFKPRIIPAQFFIACLFLGPLLFVLTSLVMKLGSHNGRYIPTEKP